jgi:peptidoglycan/xylan/chitin deacetylase (PgdA/CDA1 family)
LLFAASLLLVLATVLSLPLHDPWWWLLPCVMLVAYQALIVWGVLDLRLNMFAPSICAVKTSRPHVSLTFDDGPDPISTPHVLDVLRAAEISATFFVIGSKVERYPALVRRIVHEGHTVAVHSYAHELGYSFLSPRYVEADILRCRRLIEECGVACSKYFRPPVGQVSPRTARGIRATGMQLIGWSVRAGDGVQRRTPNECVARVCAGVKPGAIVLLHDAWQGRSLEDTPRVLQLSPDERLALAPAGARSLPQIITQLKQQGYQCVPLHQLLSAQPVAS